LNGFVHERVSHRNRRPLHLFEAWPEIRARILSAEQCALFLDFDGTLVPVKRHASDVRAPARVTRILGALAQCPHIHVAIVSGRRFAKLRKLLGVSGIHYIGLHGEEIDGKSVRVALSARAALSFARRAVRRELACLPGVWLENKGLSFSIHYRGAHPAVVRAAHLALPGLLKPWEGTLHVLNGRRVWEVLPRDIPGKFAAVRKMFARLPKGTPVVYVGDDGTDEPAFVVLRNQITVRVRPVGTTKAAYYLRTPAEVVSFLGRIEREIC
jgi:trehalose-phosphatase